jgi:hypothetical protein
MQPNGDQEVELMFQAVSFRGKVEELAAGGRGSRRRKRQTRSCGEERERFMVALDGW